MRKLDKVIERMLDVIPINETLLREELYFIKKNCAYTSPECMPLQWEKVGEILQDNLPAPTQLTQDWQVQLVTIIRGEQ